MDFKRTKAVLESISILVDVNADKIDQSVATAIKQKIEEAKLEPKKEIADLFNQREAKGVLEILNPVVQSGKRMFAEGLFIQQIDDVADPRKLALTSVQAMKKVNAENAELIAKNKELSERIEKQQALIEAQQRKIDALDQHIDNDKSFFGKLKRFVKSKAFIGAVAGIVLTASVAGNIVLGANLAKTKSQKNFFESRYEYVLAENEKAKDALEMFDYKFDESKPLDEIVADVYSGTSEKHKQEVDQAYAMVVKVFTDNNIDLGDIYDEQTGKYDVSKLQGELGETVKNLMQNTANLKAVEKQVGATLDIVQIAKRDENGQVILKDGKVEYKTLEDYETLADAVEDIGKNYQSCIDREVASLGATIDQALQTASSSKTMKDFTSIKSAIEYLGTLSKSANDEIARLSSELAERDRTIAGLNEQIRGLKIDYDALMTVKGQLEQKVRDLENQKSGNQGQEVSDKGNGGNTASPVAGEDKDKDNTGGHQRPGQREDGSGGSGSYDENDYSR